MVRVRTSIYVLVSLLVRYYLVRVGVVFVLVLLTLVRAAYKYVTVRSWYCNNGARRVLESWFVVARFIFCLRVTT